MGFGYYRRFKTVILVILKVLNFDLEKVPHLKFDTHILCQIKFGNFKGPKSAILVILKAPTLDFLRKFHI